MHANAMPRVQNLGWERTRRDCALLPTLISLTAMLPVHTAARERSISTSMLRAYTNWDISQEYDRA